MARLEVTTTTSGGENDHPWQQQHHRYRWFGPLCLPPNSFPNTVPASTPPHPSRPSILTPQTDLNRRPRRPTAPIHGDEDRRSWPTTRHPEYQHLPSPSFLFHHCHIPNRPRERPFAPLLSYGMWIGQMEEGARQVSGCHWLGML